MAAAWILANWFHKTATNDKQIQKQMQEAAEKLQENKNVHRQIKFYERENLRLAMDNYIFEEIKKLHKEDQTYIKKLNEATMEEYKITVELKYELQQLEFKRMVECRIQQVQAKYATEFKEMQEEFERNREIYDKMENRNIVQQLRQEQRELSKVKGGLEGVQLNANIYMVEAMNKVGILTAQRNQVIVKLIEGGKELKELEEKFQNIEQLDSELKNAEQKQIESQHQLKSALTKPSSNLNTALVKPIIIESNDEHIYSKVVFDPLNAMKFLKSIPELNISTDFEFYKPKQKSSEKQLHSILRKPSSDLDRLTSEKRVSFMLSESSSVDSEYTVLPAAAHNDLHEHNKAVVDTEMCNDDDNSDQEEFIELILNEHPNIEQMYLNKTKTEADLIFGNLLPENKSTVQHAEKWKVTSVKKQINKDEVKTAAYETLKQNIEIKENRVVKPAGKPIPKMLSLDLAVETAATSDEGRVQSLSSPVKETFNKPVIISKQHLQHYFDEFLNYADSEEAQSNMNKQQKSNASSILKAEDLDKNMFLMSDDNDNNEENNKASLLNFDLETVNFRAEDKNSFAIDFSDAGINGTDFL